MGKIKDLTGQKFGRLLVLEITPERRNRQVVWKCLCDCGNVSYVVGQALRSGHTKTCGCSWHEPRGEDLTGQIFGDLTVLYRDFNKKSTNRNAFWVCKCSCGQERIVSAGELRAGAVSKCISCTQLYTIAHRKKYEGPGPIKNKIGERFGKLVVIAATEKRKNGKMVWQCQCDCGNLCEATSNALISGDKTSCGCTNQSNGENLVEQILQVNNIPYRKQVTLPGIKDKEVLRYDFGILNNNQSVIRLIEFDGIQHYQPIEFFGGEDAYLETIKRDKIKNEGAQSYSIPLIRIPYYKKQTLTLEDLLGDEFLVNKL